MQNKQYIYSGNSKLVGYAVIIVTLSIVGVLWLYHATDKPLNPRELYTLETVDAH